MVTAVVIALEFVVSILYLVDVLSSMVVDALINLLAGVTMGVVTGSGSEVLADANVNVFASLMTDLEFAVPKPTLAVSC